MTNTIEQGNIGEQAAAEYLISEGFHIAARNWRSGRYELDIIATKGDTLHFVEVKLRKRGGLTTPEEAITKLKFESLCKAARAYIAINRIDLEIQFDLIAVDSTPDGLNVRYIPNAMTPRW